jgi:hypothetical protein
MLLCKTLQSVTADFYREEDRGKAFGTLHLTSAAGAALGGLYATNVGALCLPCPISQPPEYNTQSLADYSPVRGVETCSLLVPV